MKSISEILAESKEIEAKSTPGPWAWHNIEEHYEVLAGPLVNLDFPSIDEMMVLDDGSANGEYAKQIESDSPNGKLIPYNKTMLPRYVAALETSTKELRSYCNYDWGSNHCAACAALDDIQRILNGVE